MSERVRRVVEMLMLRDRRKWLWWRLVPRRLHRSIVWDRKPEVRGE